MNNLPQWIKKILKEEKLTCGKCGRVFEPQELLSVGIQKSSKNASKEVLALSIFCKPCDEMTIFEIQEMTLLDLSFDVLSEQSEKQIENAKKELDEEMGIVSKSKPEPKPKPRSSISKKPRSKITLKEIRDTVKFLNEIDTHDDLLLAMGMSLEEIEKYNIKPKKKG